jgi:hypothetical protein
MYIHFTSFFMLLPHYFIRDQLDFSCNIVFFACAHTYIYIPDPK